uniref:Uncharacterized protein n=1 Tax=Meloidogyne enterolobii TaxID=390850 RepID=A0A6V7UXE0_MELEN|nr:unnamed protein product [Meloidogyne enterolobii]
MEKREELILVVEMNRESPLCVLLHNVMAVVLVMEIRSGFCCATEFKQRTTTRIWRCKNLIFTFMQFNKLVMAIVPLQRSVLTVN